MSSIDRRSRLGTLVVMVLVASGCGGSLGGAGTGPGGGFGKGTGRGGTSGPSGGSGVAGSVGLGGAEGPGGAFGAGTGTGTGDMSGGLGSGAGGQGNTTTSGGGGAGGVTGTGGSDPCTHSAAGEVPSEHRSMAPSCVPNAPVPLAMGGVPSCVTNADCTTLGYGSCTAGQCMSDLCLADGDCQRGYACACGGKTVTVSPPAGATDAASQAYAVNVCVPATCRLDGDCGLGGYCSPSYNGCGTLEGYYCHGPADTCVDPAKDCCGSPYCIWMTTTGAFTCAYQTCITD